MAHQTTEPWVQLATRVPKSLHRDLKLHCVQAETSVMDFVVAALKEKLARESGRERRARYGRTG
jgi:predicted HicB family RNase H-like nuclease